MTPSSRFYSQHWECLSLTKLLILSTVLLPCTYFPQLHSQNSTLGFLYKFDTDLVLVDGILPLVDIAKGLLPYYFLLIENIGANFLEITTRLMH